MTANSESLKAAVERLAQSKNRMSWDEIRGHLVREKFASAELDNNRTILGKLYLGLRARHDESLFRAQPTSMPSPPETSPSTSSASITSSSSEHAAVSPTSQNEFPENIFMFVEGERYDIMSCEHNQENNESYISRAAVEARYLENRIDRGGAGCNITLSWRKVDSKKTYRTTFTLVPGSQIESDISFGRDWLGAAPQEKPQERKRKGFCDDLDGLEQPFPKRVSPVSTHDMALFGATFGTAFGTAFDTYMKARSQTPTRARYHQSSSSSSERFAEIDGSDMGERLWNPH